MKNPARVLGIIPARYASTRLPGKPLVEISGKPMIQWVYEAAKKALPNVVIATDDSRIADVVLGFGGRAIMTNPEHVNGTSRCLEAFQLVCKQDNTNYDLIINIQGDEPMLHPEVLEALTSCFHDPGVAFATLVTPVLENFELDNQSEVFVTFDDKFDALYFSRSPIPFLRDVPKSAWLSNGKHYKHLGLYGYTPDTLAAFAEMPPGRLEQLEMLEQLRWLENGGKIRVAITPYSSLPVDTPEDLTRVRELMQK
jgi:3-deoxy-manno-octulosonate cytidylyltransferase (CMP-KDO synthetase)